MVTFAPQFFQITFLVPCSLISISVFRVWKLDFQAKGEVDKEGEEGGGHPFLTQEPDPKRDKPDREEDENTGEEEEDSKTDELNDDNSVLKA